MKNNILEKKDASAASAMALRIARLISSDRSLGDGIEERQLHICIRRCAILILCESIPLSIAKVLVNAWFDLGSDVIAVYKDIRCVQNDLMEIREFTDDDFDRYSVNNMLETVFVE